MPTLSWIGKDAVVNHHREVPYRLLRDVPDLGCGEVGSGNLLVEGDNLHALKALLPYYAGQVKCIYIDPPYNTGNEGWVYNDAVNSPLIQRWLGETVGKEAEDLSRHDKWLCMMYPRLQLLKQFLREDGAIFVSIDDNELGHLLHLLRDVFGAGNLVANFLWKRRTTPDSRNLNGISADHEYVICFAKSQGFRFQGAAKDFGKYSNPDADPRGPWMSDNLTGLANAVERPNLHYDLINPTTKHAYPPHPSRGWIYGKDRMTELIRENKILWPAKTTGRPRLKRFVSDMQSSTTGFSTILEAPGNVEATKELSAILGPKVFAFPKPSELIKLIVEQGTSPGDLILDSFMGSGTTAHAVLKLNAAQPDQPPRRFIGIEMEPKIAEDVTAERIRRVASGYTNAKGETVPGLGGGFRYCRLDAPLFSAAGVINPDVRFLQLARHVFFTETGEPLPNDHVPESALIGVHRGTGIYLLFNGILGDHSRNGGNVLTRAVLAQLPLHTGPKVIYAYGCLLGEDRLRTEQITFRQTPYEIATS